MKLQLTKKQKMFIDADADEVLFGGAAGGGKSYVQLIDSFLYALKYPKSKQLILRRTYPELYMSLIRGSLELFPTEACTYNQGNHTWTFKNGSLIDFGYCNGEDDVYRYQSAEYDVIRFDELTHFTEHMYTYLISRLRGSTPYPRSMRCTTNPGGIGHSWVKARWIDPSEPLVKFGSPSRLFIPARVEENKFLMEADPDYLKRLDELPENERKALRDGDWDVFEGRFFPEWTQATHVVEPFPIPKGWRRVFAMDYGLDMLAGIWIALDTMGNAYVYRELGESGLIISSAAERILAYNEKDDIVDWAAPPDLWNKRQETGRSAYEIFASHGIPLRKVSNNREQGWLDLKEWIKPVLNEQGQITPRLRVFSNCRQLIKCMGSVLYDEKNANDMANEPHELTHFPDALRYFATSRPLPAERLVVKEYDDDYVDFDEQLESLCEEF